MGGSTKVVQPAAAPAPPSVAQSAQDYVNSLPQIYAAELQYNPLYAQQDYDLAAQYAPMYAELARSAEAGAYPYTAGLQEQLAKQASEGINSPLPDYLKTQYQDMLRSEIGDNAGSGIGADYVSTNLLNLGKSYQDYYRDLGLSVTNRLPLTQTGNPAFRNAGAGYDYGATSGFQASGYGNYAGAYANIANSANQANASNYKSKLGLIGTGIGSATGFLTGFTPGGGR